MAADRKTAALAMMFGAALVLAPLAAHAAGASPAALRCEYRVNPLGIDETAPRLSWRLRGQARGEMQTAYQVLVATSPDALKVGRADLWDSGKVAGDQSVHVVYGGKSLGSGARCFWKVRVWDRSGAPSSYSPVASWEMGLLQPSEWTGRWIGLPAARDPFHLEGTRWFWYPEGNPAAGAPERSTRFFRRVLALPADRKIKRAQFLLAADDEFTLFVNGQEAGRGAAWAEAHRIDLTSLLKPGANVLGLAVLNQAGPAGILGRLQVEYEAGAPDTLDVDTSWRTTNREAAGWKGADFAAEGWVAPLQIAQVGQPPWGAVRVGQRASPSPYLRKSFTLDKPVRRARAYVTALGAYQLHLNGRRVGDSILGPGWTDYRKRVQYETYDVTDLLKRGGNAVGAILGDGWYAGSLGPSLQRNHFGPDPARLRLQIRVEHTDGAVTTLATDESWRGAVGPIRESDIYAGETYDARLETPGWDSAAFAGAGDWKPVAVFTTPNPELNARVDPPIRVTQTVPTRAITQPKPGVYIFDLGQNLVGWARLQVRGPAGTQVTLRFAETLNPDGTVYRENLRLARATDTYILSGKGVEVYEPHFTYHGFRYVEVTGLPEAPSTEAITARVFHSDMPLTSRFETSNSVVNQIYRNVLWGQRSNMMSVPTDCPQRDERLGWMGDAQLFARTSCWNMDMSAFYTKWMRDIIDAQSPAGGFSDISPRVVDMADGAPAWAEAGLVIPWTMYQCYGDTRILERNFNAMRRYVDLLHASNPDLLWLRRRNNDFGDWVPASEQTNKDLIASAYFAYDARLLSRMAAAIGRTADAEKYGQLADRVRDAFNARFLSADGKYTGDTQTAYAMALALNLAPEGRRAQVSERLVQAIDRRLGRLSTGFIGTTLLLPALSESGHDDVAYRLLQTTRYPSWGYMVANGATTIWELWNSDKEGPAMNSRNHFAFGGVAEWLQRYLAGIDTDPAAPGYKRIIIRPRVGGGMTSARAEYDSSYGTIVSAWRTDGGGLSLHVETPANTTARIYAPKSGRGAARITEGGKTVWSGNRFHSGVSGIVSATSGPEGVVFEVGSGSYDFRITAE